MLLDFKNNETAIEKLRKCVLSILTPKSEMGFNVSFY